MQATSSVTKISGNNLSLNYSDSEMIVKKNFHFRDPKPFGGNREKMKREVNSSMIHKNSAAAVDLE